MKKENIAIVLAIFAFIFGFIGMVGDKSTSPNVGGTTNYDNLTLGNSSSVATGQDGRLTTQFMTVNKALCIDSFATSTATASKIEFYATTTGAGVGSVKVSYGSCS